jgi:hypothetical protein
MLPFLMWPLLEVGCFGPGEGRTTVFAALRMPGGVRALLRGVLAAVVAVSAAVQALGVSMN